ncbi:hypothetical protein H6B10_16685, partial [Gemmiger formicilis]|nr:hypothetical protein [Gemmiger formicilis]
VEQVAGAEHQNFPADKPVLELPALGRLHPARDRSRRHANIDLTRVRFNSVQYNIRDLESKIYVPERNRLIVDTWL